MHFKIRGHRWAWLYILMSLMGCKSDAPIQGRFSSQTTHYSFEGYQLSLYSRIALVDETYQERLSYRLKFENGQYQQLGYLEVFGTVDQQGTKLTVTIDEVDIDLDPSKYRRYVTDVSPELARKDLPVYLKQQEVVMTVLMNDHNLLCLERANKWPRCYLRTEILN